MAQQTTADLALRSHTPNPKLALGFCMDAEVAFLVAILSLVFYLKDVDQFPVNKTSSEEVRLGVLNSCNYYFSL